MEKYLRQFELAVIFDDHQIFSSSFSMFLERLGVFSAVYSFNTEGELRDFFVNSPITSVCLFMDYYIPGCNPLFLLSDLRRYCPSIKVIIVSSVTNPVLLKQVLLNKVDGVISKIDEAHEVLAGLQAIKNRQVYLSKSVAKILDSDCTYEAVTSFSVRELEVLTCLSDTHTIEQIAEKLNISKYTVLTHRKNLLAKSGFHSVRELVAFSIRSGLIVNQ